MKRITKLFVVLSMLFCMSTSVSAQNYKNDGKPYDFFCQLRFKTNLAGKLRMEVLWDSQRKEVYLRTQDGEKIEFASTVDAMNYMSKRGWTYVENVVYQDGSSMLVHYMFKKTVTKDEEAKEGLYFNTDFQ